MLEVLFSVMTDDELVNCFKRIDYEITGLSVQILLSQSTYNKGDKYLRFENLVSVKEDINLELELRGVKI